MFRLDALVLLRANEASLWGNSIYSYVEACWRMIILIAYVVHAYWLFDLRCSWVDVASADSTSKLLVCGNPAVEYVIATITIEVRALWCRSYADCFLQVHYD